MMLIEPFCSLSISMVQTSILKYEPPNFNEPFKSLKIANTRHIYTSNSLPVTVTHAHTEIKDQLLQESFIFSSFPQRYRPTGPMLSVQSCPTVPPPAVQPSARVCTVSQSRCAMPGPSPPTRSWAIHPPVNEHQKDYDCIFLSFDEEPPPLFTPWQVRLCLTPNLPSSWIIYF